MRIPIALQYKRNLQHSAKRYQSKQTSGIVFSRSRGVEEKMSHTVENENTNLLEKEEDPAFTKIFPNASCQYSFECTDTDGNKLSNVEQYLVNFLHMSPLYRSDDNLVFVSNSRSPPTSWFKKWFVTKYMLKIETTNDPKRFLVRHVVGGTISPKTTRYDEFVCKEVNEDGIGVVWEGTGYVTSIATRLLTCCLSGETEYKQRMILIDEKGEKEVLLHPVPWAQK